MENIELLKEYEEFQQTLADCWLKMCHVYVAYSKDDKKGFLDTTLAWRELMTLEIKIHSFQADDKIREDYVRFRTKELISGSYPKLESLEKLYSLLSDVIAQSEELIIKAREETDEVGTKLVSRLILDTDRKSVV